MRFSANTGFLWKELPFLDRIRAAAAAGFDGVEFHDEAQDADLDALRDTLEEGGLRVLGLNVRMGASAGCAAIPGAEDDAMGDFERALHVADAIDARAIHVLAGKTSDREAEEVLARNLRRFAAMTGRVILVEPLSRRAVPGYAVNSLDQAARIIAQADAPNLRILFDCFHVLAEGEDLHQAFERHAGLVGHVQVASFPGRNEPGRAGPDYRPLMPRLAIAGLDWLGCEFIPTRQPISPPEL